MVERPLKDAREIRETLGGSLFPARRHNAKLGLLFAIFYWLHVARIV